MGRFRMGAAVLVLMSTGAVLAPSAAAAGSLCAPVGSDFNGDGRPDLAMSGWISPVAEGGAVRVVYATAGGLDPTGAAQTFTNTTPGLPADDTPGAHAFGADVQAGSFNGDCQADLAIGMGAGKLLVLYGSPQGLRPQAAQRFTAAQLAPVGQDGRALGTRLAAGDFNGDGVDDLAAAAPWSNNYRGGLAVLSGSTTGLRNPQWFTRDK